MKNTKDIKIVIGANFGDEGKGLMTDYFAKKAVEQSRKCLVVCHNGGSQKGHTVKLKDGIRHVFHHFGSGTFQGADTYLARTFILNPIIFRKEYEELQSLGFTPVCYVNKDSYITTPFDMLMNQIVEEERGAGKHGSCGYGIFETLKRHEQNNFSTNLGKFWFSKDDSCILKELVHIKNDYLDNRLEELGCTTYKTNELYEISQSTDMLHNWLDDFQFMKKHTVLVEDEILNHYDSIVFEGAQGLLLDQNNIEYMPHLTPSNTGCLNPLDMLKEMKDIDVEICYVTRSYLTRHGAGRFDKECEKKEINSSMFDETNVTNPFQDTLRYGKINQYTFIDRIANDYKTLPFCRPQISIAITHLNETDNKVCCLDKNISFDEFVTKVNKFFEISSAYFGFSETSIVKSIPNIANTKEIKAARN